MKAYRDYTEEELQKEKQQLISALASYKEKGLALDMSRGKPGADQLDLSMGMLDVFRSDSNTVSGGLDVRNYGGLDGLPEVKKLFAELLGVSDKEVIVGGNSSLNLMHDTVSRAYIHGVIGSVRPWKSEKLVKFLCPAPGYDRHFAVCEYFGIEMITIPMKSSGPDMDMVEKLAAEDASVKGIWCVPKYSNPDGFTYSDETVKRLASMKTAAPDFRIFWDNAYLVHDLTNTPDPLLNILDACKAVDNADRVFLFASTSKISFSGAGVAAMAASIANIELTKKQLSIQTIGYDKVNQLRHLLFFGNLQGIKDHMEKHKKILQPKFGVVVEKLSALEPYEIVDYHKPNGGYFVSVNVPKGTAKRVIQLCKENGVVLTPAGATYPYGKDPEDRNIRVAPTYPPVSELTLAMEVFSLAVRLAAVEQFIEA